MKRTVLAVLALVAALSVYAVARASTSYYVPSSSGLFAVKGGKAVQTTISESPPTLSTDGTATGDLDTFALTLEVNLVVNDSTDAALYPSDAGLNRIGWSCSLRAWVFEPYARAWSRAPALDVDASGAGGLTRWTKTGNTSPKLRLAYVASNCDSPLTIYLDSYR